MKLALEYFEINKNSKNGTLKCFKNGKIKNRYLQKTIFYLYYKLLNLKICLRKSVVKLVAIEELLKSSSSNDLKLVSIKFKLAFMRKCIS